MVGIKSVDMETTIFGDPELFDLTVFCKFALIQCVHKSVQDEAVGGVAKHAEIPFHVVNFVLVFLLS